MSRPALLRFAAAALLGWSPSCETTDPIRDEVVDNLRGLISMPSEGIVLGTWDAEPERLLPLLVDAASSAYPRADIRSKPESSLVYFWHRTFDESPARAVFLLRRRDGSPGSPACDLVAYPLQRTADAPLHHREIPPTETLLAELRERLREAGVSETVPETRDSEPEPTSNS